MKKWNACAVRPVNRAGRVNGATLYAIYLKRYVTPRERILQAMEEIKDELADRRRSCWQIIARRAAIK